MWAEALKITGPDTPWAVNTISRKIAVHFFGAIQQRHRHIAQRQPFQTGRVFAPGPQPDQRGQRLFHGVAQSPGHGVAVSVGTCGGVGYAAGGQDHPVGGQRRAVLAQNTYHPAVLHLYFVSPQRVHFHMAPVQQIPQGAADVPGPV